MNCAEILAHLTESELDLFRKTSLYKHHFDSELVVLYCAKSVLCYNSNNRVRFMRYQIKSYRDQISFSAELLDDNSLTDANLIREYLNGSNDIAYNTDTRYYKNHPPDLFLQLKCQSMYGYCDYNILLQQGNKPRFMYIYISTGDAIATPEYVEYLKINCHHNNEQHTPINIPDNVLFLDTSCSFDYDKAKFVTCEIMPKNTNYNKPFERSKVSSEAFYRYTFKRGTKSARTTN